MASLPPPPRPTSTTIPRKPVPIYPDLSSPSRAHETSHSLHSAQTSPSITPPGTPLAPTMSGPTQFILTADQPDYEFPEKGLPSTPADGMSRAHRAWRKGSPAPVITPRTSSAGIYRNGSPTTSMTRSASSESYGFSPPIPASIPAGPILPNSKIHYLRAARGLSPPVSPALSSQRSATPPMGLSPIASSSALGNAGEVEEGTQEKEMESYLALNGLGIRDSITPADPEIPSITVPPPTPPTAPLIKTDTLPSLPSTPPAADPPAATEEVIEDPLKGIAGIKKAPGFTIDAPPTKMRLWEASQCFITDERGKQRRFGDFWDDLSVKKKQGSSSRSPSINSRPGSSPLAGGGKGGSGRISMSEMSTTGRLSIDSGMMNPSPTSEYVPSLRPRSPSLRTINLGSTASLQQELADVPATINPAPAGSGTPKTLSRQSTQMTGTTMSTGTPSEKQRRREEKERVKRELKKIGGEEWIVMGRKTVVFWIRHFWCGQCQDYTFASLSQLDPIAIHAAGINVIVISNGHWKIIKKYRELFRCPYPIYVDGSRRLYRLMGMTLENNDFGPMKDRAAYHRSNFAMQTVHGATNGLFRMPLRNPGLFTQLGGEYIMGPGLRCDFVHRMTTTSNHIEAPEVLKLAGVAAPTIPEQLAIQVAQSEIDALAQMHEEMEAWRDGRETELMRIKRDKAERRGLVYEPSLVNRDSVVSGGFGIMEEGGGGEEEGQEDGGEEEEGEEYLNDLQETEDQRVYDRKESTGSALTEKGPRRNSHYTVGTEGDREETASLSSAGGSVATEEAVDGDDAGSFGPRTGVVEAGLFYGKETN